MKSKSRPKTKKPVARKRRQIRTEPGLAPLLRRARGVSPRVNPDGRSAKTIDQILLATISLMLRHGSAHLSMRDICEHAGVSRGTLYRYFSSKEEVLHGVTLHLRTQTDRAVKESTDPYDDPEMRFQGFLSYMLNNEETSEAAHFLEAEPIFIMKYLKANFGHFTARINEALGPVFDHWDQQFRGQLDRELFAEMFVRYALSEMLIPSGPSRRLLPRRIGAMLKLWRKSAGGQTPGLGKADAEAAS